MRLLRCAPPASQARALRALSKAEVPKFLGMRRQSKSRRYLGMAEVLLMKRAFEATSMALRGVALMNCENRKCLGIE